MCQCLGKALKGVFDKKGPTRAETGQNLDQSKMFLTELLGSRCYLTFVVEFNSAVIVIIFLCLYLVQGGGKNPSIDLIYCQPLTF